ncbi:MAG: hypothetical protein AAF399_16705, partial [Bacteroidota bacterium]
MITKPSLASGWTVDEVQDRLEQLTVEELRSHLLPYAMEFLTKETPWLLKQEERVAEHAKKAVHKTTGKLKRKMHIISVVSLAFLTPACFQRFRTYLPKEANRVLETVVLDGAITSEDISLRYNIISAHKVERPLYSYGERFKIVSAFRVYFTPNQYSYYNYHGRWATFFWPYMLRELAIPLLFPEAPALIFDPSAPEPGVQTFEGETLVQEELPGLLIRLRQKAPKLSKMGRPSIATVRSIGKKLKLQEFFPDTQDKRLEALRARCLVGLLARFPNLSTPPSPEAIKQFFDEGCTQKFHPPIHLLNYLKGIDRISFSWMYRQGKEYHEAISGLPVEKWVRYGSLIQSLKAQAYTLNLTYVDGVQNLEQEISLDPEDRYDYHNKLQIYPFLKERLFHWAAFHAMTFTLAAWGLLDIRYYPTNHFPARYVIDSPLNRIVAIRLTKLGAYVLDRTDHYESTVKPPFVLSLATDSLSILLEEGDQARAAMAIQSFARPLGQHRFYTQAKLFLDDCKSSDELTQKIQLFKSIFPGDLPANWAAFFEAISQQVNPLQPAGNYKVFHLDPENTQLLQLIARDPELKALSLKAEGYLLLVKNRELKKFKSRLQAL